jgi:general L-amino acid transport system permease protein
MSAREPVSGAATLLRVSPQVGPLTWLRHHVFATPVDMVLGIVLLVIAVLLVPRIVTWAFVDSVVLADSPAGCAAATGACWAVVYAHGRAIIFGLYPYAEQWRAALALAIVAAALATTFALGATRLRAVALAWFAAAVLFVVLMGGGVFGLTAVAMDAWGGLPLSIFVFIATLLIGFPLSILLALGRGSRLCALRIVCTGAIELVRALPILTLLFCAAIVVPLMLPGWFNPDKVLRVIAAMAFFYACFQAEIIRGGLQGVANAQVQAALSLGMTALQVKLFVELPQALRFTVPATINQMVVALKDTSMLLVVGLFDFLASANTAITKDEWARYFAELYLFVAAVFLILTHVLGALERRFVGDLERG